MVRYAPPRVAAGFESEAQPSVRASVGAPDSQQAREDRAAGGAGSRAKVSAPIQKSAWLSTGYGQIEESNVTTTDFDCASVTPAGIITIYYDSHRNMVAQGVISPPSIARPDPL